MDNVQHFEWMNMSVTMWVDHYRDILVVKIAGYDREGKKRGCQIRLNETTLEELPQIWAGQRYPAADLGSLFVPTDHEVDFVAELAKDGPKEEAKDE